MKPLMLLVATPVWLAGPLAEPDFDWPSFIERFGLPLALLVIVLWTGARGTWVWGTQLRSSVAEVTRLTGLLAVRDTTIERLHREALQREQQLVAGFGNRLYDAAVLYQQGTELVAKAAPAAAVVRADHDEHVGRLVSDVEQLLARLGDVRPGPDG